MIKRVRLIAIAALAITIGGCSTVKSVLPGLGDNPVDAAVTAVEAAVTVADIQWYGPECSDPADREKFCDTWRDIVKPAIAGAIERAESAYDLSLRDLNANEIARAAIGETLEALSDVAKIDPNEKRRNIYRHVQTALVLLRSAMEPPRSSSKEVT